MWDYGLLFIECNLLQVDYIDSIIASIKSEEEKDKSEMELDPVEAYLRKQEAKKAGKSSSSSGKSLFVV